MIQFSTLITKGAYYDRESLGVSLGRHIASQFLIYEAQIQTTRIKNLM